MPCSGDEQKFLEAQQAFNAGKPIMNDTDYDALKQKLRQGGSFVTAQGPRCSIRSRAVYSDAQVDYTKMVAINIPPALLVSLGDFEKPIACVLALTRCVLFNVPCTAADITMLLIYSCACCIGWCAHQSILVAGSGCCVQH